MDARVIKIEKSATFGQSVNDRTRFVAVVTFVRANNGSKFAAGTFGTNHTYKASMDLVAVYGDDEECKTEGKFNGELAFKKLEKEYTPEGINLYDIPLGGKYKVIASGNIMETARVAIYDDEEAATKFALNALSRDIKAQRIKKVEEENEKEKEGE